MVARTLVAGEVGLLVVVWLLSPFKALPRPLEVLEAFRRLWFEHGLGPELFASFLLNVEALAIVFCLCLALAYATVLPAFRPLVGALTKGRFLSITGLTFVFTLLVGGGHPLKVSLLVFATSVFFLTSMTAEVAAIPRERFDYARTLRFREWQIVWEVVVLGTFDKAIEVLRQNAAIAWMMLTMVEGIVRSEGGVGTVLLDENKQFHLAEVFAIQITILMVGLFQDYAIGVVKGVLLPYADLGLERR